MHCVSTVKTNRFMLLRKTITVYFENHMKDLYHFEGKMQNPLMLKQLIPLCTKWLNSNFETQSHLNCMDWNGLERNKLQVFRVQAHIPTVKLGWDFANLVEVAGERIHRYAHLILLNIFTLSSVHGLSQLGSTICILEFWLPQVQVITAQALSISEWKVTVHSGTYCTS
jgi:hypothetical protein